MLEPNAPRAALVIAFAVLESLWRQSLRRLSPFCSQRALRSHAAYSDSQTLTAQEGRQVVLGIRSPSSARAIPDCRVMLGACQYAIRDEVGQALWSSILRADQA